jgi:nitrogen fixation protein NifU and related proteins
MITKKIIKLASKTNNYGLKNEYTHKMSVKNKQCGDQIKIEIKTKGNKIVNMRYETNSCIFCEASASLLSNKINLFTIDSFNKDFDLISKFLKYDSIKLPKKFEPFKDILNKKNYSRIDCITLPYIATIKALKL